MRELISRHTPDCLGIRPEPTGHHPILKLCDRRNNSCYLLEINRLGSHIFKNDQNIFLLSAFLWGSSLVAQVIYNWGTFSSTMHVFTATSFLRCKSDSYLAVGAFNLGILGYHLARTSGLLSLSLDLIV